MTEDKNNEQEKEEEDKTESTTDNSGEGNISGLVKATDEANKASERMADERRQLDASIAKAKLAGVTEAGKPTESKKEETAKEYNDRINKEIAEGKHGE